ncbi:Gfo/Idh/MocA family oxidoreductase [Candidatus Thioglobus sp.]|nr:Gfo/Idh/MocA family oxidoreductase [Candidatus Thioglobus sp.]
MISEDKKLNIAIIGYGSWAKNYLSTIYNNPSAQIKWIVAHNTNVDTIHSINCKVLTKWQDLFEERGIDGIIVAVPPKLQLDIALRCIDKNIPLLLEKPLALDLGTVELLLSSCKKNKSKVMVDYTYLYNLAFRKALDSLHLIGPIKKIVSIGGNYGPFRDTCPVLWDWAPHDVSMCIRLMNEVPEVLSSKKDYIKIKSQQGEIIESNLLFSNGTQANLTFGNGMRNKKRLFKIVGEDGELVFNDLIKDKLMIVQGSYSTQLPIELKSPLELLTEDFFTMIRKKNKSYSDVVFSTYVTKVISDIENSMC